MQLYKFFKNKKEGNYVFIVVTGLDGSGTSTVAEKLHQMDRGSFLFHTPSSIYSDRENIDNDVRNTSQMAHYLYYLSSVVYLSDYVKKTLTTRKIMFIV